MNKPPRPSVDDLHERLSYDPETGSLIRKRSGAEAKSLDLDGYIQVSMSGFGTCKAHRIAWAMHYGSWPELEIDHINGARSDNRIANLREVDRAHNIQNVRIGSRKNLSTGMLGVYICNSTTRPYSARIKVGGKTLHLGSYSTVEQAHAAYVIKKREIHPGCTI